MVVFDDFVWRRAQVAHPELAFPDTSSTKVQCEDVLRPPFIVISPPSVLDWCHILSSTLIVQSLQQGPRCTSTPMRQQIPVTKHPHHQLSQPPPPHFPQLRGTRPGFSTHAHLLRYIQCVNLSRESFLPSPPSHPSGIKFYVKYPTKFPGRVLHRRKKGSPSSVRSDVTPTGLALKHHS